MWIRLSGNITLNEHSFKTELYTVQSHLYIWNTLIVYHAINAAFGFFFFSIIFALIQGDAFLTHSSTVRQNRRQCVRLLLSCVCKSPVCVTHTLRTRQHLHGHKHTELCQNGSFVKYPCESSWIYVKSCASDPRHVRQFLKLQYTCCCDVCH